MKKYLLLCYLSLISVASFCQFADKFGTISIEEANMKECSFDPEASAVVLLDEGYSDFADDNSLMTYYHERIKILKEDGKKYGDVRADVPQ